MRATPIGHSQAQRELTRAVRATMQEFVLPGSMIFTDDWGGYNAVEQTGQVPAPQDQALAADLR